MSDNAQNTSGPAVSSSAAATKNKSFMQRNAETFLTANKIGNAVYLNGEEKDGFIVMKPTAIRNAITGRAFIGTNQLLAQQMQYFANSTDNEVLTYDQAKIAGTFIPKPKQGEKTPCFILTTPGNKENNQEPGYFTYFFKSSVFNKSAIDAARFIESNYSRRNRTVAILAKENDPAKREKLLTDITYTNRNILYGTFYQDKDNEKLIGREGMLNKFLEKMPDDQKKEFEKTFLQTPEMKDKLLQGFSDRNFESFAKKQLQENAEYKNSQDSKEPKVIDATNCHSPNEYLGKYLAATSLGAVFKTDKESIEAVKKEITESLEQSFMENKHYDAFRLGQAANEMCVGTIREFRSKSYEQQVGRTPARDVIQERPEQDIEMTIG